MGVIPPWPPLLPQAKLPFDQRGACWPWGPCGPQTKLELRYTAIGIRLIGPINPVWGQLATGQLMLIDPAQVNGRRAFYMGKFNPLVSHDDLILERPVMDDAQWTLDFYGEASNIPYIYLRAQGGIDATWCTDGVAIPITDIQGPNPQPEQMFFKPIAWYQTSPYPYLGL